MKIDFHYHCADKPGAVDELLLDMDRAGVDWTLLMGGPEDAFWEFKNCGFAPNATVLEAVKKHADRLIGNIYIDPRQADALDTLEKYLAAGFRAVKLFPPVGFYADEERFYPLYERIEQAGIPVLAHTGQTNIKVISHDPKVRRATSTKYAHPMTFDGIARLFPKIPFVLAHMGYPYYVDAWSVAHANPNIYLDIAGSGPWTEGIPVVFNALGGHQFIPVDFKRVLWGSDNCLPQAEHIARSEVYLRQMGCASAERKLVFGETAKKLLNI
jgi:predicted TIM-barrel fold metal-dependent hydrolase